MPSSLQLMRVPPPAPKSVGGTGGSCKQLRSRGAFTHVRPSCSMLMGYHKHMQHLGFSHSFFSRQKFWRKSFISRHFLPRGRLPQESNLLSLCECSGVPAMRKARQPTKGSLAWANAKETPSPCECLPRVLGCTSSPTGARKCCNNCPVWPSILEAEGPG